jgi:hypothetical protein
MNNIHSAAIPADILAQALAKTEEIRMLLAPYITPLTPSQRHSIAKMGDKTLAFVEKAHELALSNPEFVPPYLNMSDFTVDFSDAHNIEPVLIAVEQLRSGVDDTQMLAGSEAYHASLVYYNSVKEAASQNVPGAKAIYDVLRIRFPHKKRRGEEGSTEE